ncbi:hypothetical protein CAMGR0001_1039 [Campylobacter gracilis RM3268]|uniref:Uncharacterized protein n=1 Tax=Campylobacter gracilis RM3268 TaxID=553220 RepID=C8PGP4_9BACT|nr:hypothetical protein CAMGR0001_1039 [Campylobacter gracilis RM3268]
MKFYGTPFRRRLRVQGLGILRHAVSECKILAQDLGRGFAVQKFEA